MAASTALTPSQNSSWLTLGPTNSVRRYSIPVAQRRLHLLHGQALRLLAAFLLLQSDEHVVGGAEFLQGHLAEAEAGKGLAHARDVGGALGAHVDHDAALEIDAVVEAAAGEQDQGRRHQDGGKDEVGHPSGDEGEICAGWNQVQSAHSLFLIWAGLGAGHA